ncbi:MAG: hypothetical protein GKR89_30090 [Candidatus Latescibacteria bacterium]|nr:hypothetical protein [Candidatus Latescibacterota bacterium]
MNLIRPLSRLLLAMTLPLWPQPSKADAAPSAPQALAALYQALLQPPTRHLQPVLDQLVEQTGLDEHQVRQQCLALLDTLAQKRKSKSDAWKQLTQLPGAEVNASSADKFFRTLLEESRLILSKEGDFSLDFPIKKATGRARIFTDQGYTLLTQAVQSGLPETEETPSEFGLLVSGHTTRYEVDKAPLFIFFDSPDEAFVLEQVREIQRFIIPRLVKVLPQSAAIKWAVRKREQNALIDPDYQLVFAVSTLRFTGSNRDLRPCIEGTVQLVETATQNAVFESDMNYCTEEAGSGNTQTLDMFYDEVASQTFALVKTFFAARR